MIYFVSSSSNFIVKELMKSLLLRAMGIDGSIEFWLFVSLATVLKRNLECFFYCLLLRMSNRQLLHCAGPSYNF